MSVKVFSNIDTTAICRKYGLGDSNKARKSLAAMGSSWLVGSSSIGIVP